MGKLFFFRRCYYNVSVVGVEAAKVCGQRDTIFGGWHVRVYVERVAPFLEVEE